MSSPTNTNPVSNGTNAIVTGSAGNATQVLPATNLPAATDRPILCASQEVLP
jgi:hypothetical protein